MEAIIIGFLEKLVIKSRRSFVLLNLSCFSSISQETKEPLNSSGKSNSAYSG